MFSRQREAANMAIAQCLKRRKDDAKAQDFCVFLHDQGYLVLHRDAYHKLSKRDKNTIMREYTYHEIN